MPDFGSGLDLGGGAGGDSAAPAVPLGTPAGSSPPAAVSQPGNVFGSMFGGPRYTAPDPAASALDQSAGLLQQRVKRANEIATNPFAQFFAPEQVQKARDFVPTAVEKLQTIEKQKADIAAGRQQAGLLGLDPGEVSDQATMADRVTAAQGRALKGDLKAFQGLQAVDPKAAEAIQDQVHSTVAANLTAAQGAFDKLANARNQGEYSAALKELRQGGSIKGLESLGLKVPDDFQKFGAVQGREASALRQARIGVDTIRQKLEDRNTYQPMEKKEAETYANRLTTVYGDPAKNVTWSRNSAAGTRGAIVNGAADPRDLGKKYALADQEQRKAIADEFKEAVPKEDMEKYRAFNRVLTLAEPTPEQKKRGDILNTSPQVQQGVSEGLASMLRGGTGGANVGLLRIESIKTGAVQSFLDGLKSSVAGGLNAVTGKDVSAYLTKISQQQRKAILDDIKAYSDATIADRTAQIAKRAGALGLDSATFGFGKNESAGPVGAALEEGRQAQIERMLPYHQAIGGGDGVFQIGAQRPGAGATGVPAGTQPATQLPGAQPLQTPVQQATSPSDPQPGTPAPPGLPVTGTPSAQPGSGVPGGVPPVGSGFYDQTVLKGGPQSPVVPPTGGPTPGRNGLPPGMPLNTSAALDAAANRTIQVESGFKPGSKTGSYVGLGQWSKEEMKRHGITDPDDIEQNRAALKADIQTRAAKLQKDGLPVTAANVYLMHQQGEAGLEAHLRAPNEPAWKNVRFGYKDDATAKAAIWGNMTPAMRQQFTDKGGVNAVTSGDFTRLWEARYNNTDGGGKFAGARDERTDPDLASYGRKHPRFSPEVDSFWDRLKRGDIPGGRATTEQARQTGTEYAPQIGSTVGAIGGAAGGPAGVVAGGAAGGGAGQMLKDYLQGRTQNPTEIAKQTALGGVLGVAPEGRPVVGALTRTLGAGGVEGAGTALQGGSVDETTSAAATGAASAAGGEAFGRALGMVGHKVWKMFSPDAKQAVIDAAKAHSEAEEVLRTEQPKLLNAAGASSGPNPKYAVAEAAKEKAEITLKDAGLNPEEAAYAHRAASEGVPRQEAVVNRPGDIEKRAVGAGYNELEQELPPRKGLKAAMDQVTDLREGAYLKDGPLAAVKNGDVVKNNTNAELAQHVENAITAPAKTWAEKWTQLREARTALLEAERDAMTSTAAGRSQTAKDMRTLADTVRTQQEKAATAVFGKKAGAEFIDRLKVLDMRYAKLMDATAGGDIAKAVAMKGEAGREAEKRFMAFAAGDPEAQRAYRAMRGIDPSAFEATVPWTVAAEGIPVIGKGIKLVKMAGMLSEYATRKAAGDPVKFRDLVKMPHDDNGRAIRNVGGTIGSHGAVGATEDNLQSAQPAGGSIASPFEPVHMAGAKPADYLRELSRNPDILRKNIEQASNFALDAGTVRRIGGKTMTERRAEIAEQLGVSVKNVTNVSRKFGMDAKQVWAKKRAALAEEHGTTEDVIESISKKFGKR
jgi:hypothetical protein